MKLPPGCPVHVFDIYNDGRPATDLGPTCPGSPTHAFAYMAEVIVCLSGRTIPPRHGVRYIDGDVLNNTRENLEVVPLLLPHELN